MIIVNAPIIDLAVSTIYVWADGLWMFDHEYSEDGYDWMSDDFASYNLAGDWHHDEIVDYVNTLP